MFRGCHRGVEIKIMRILVTGGAGFIGSHLCERLLDLGHVLTIVDEMNDFYPTSEKRANLAAVRRHGAVQFFQADVSDAAAIAGIMEQARPEAVIHLAARAGVRPSLEQPLLYGRSNILGTMAVLDESSKHGVGKFVFASSSSIYGIANRVPFSEDDHLNLPISPYAATKIAGEKIAYTYSHLYGMATVCLRFFTVYGPRQRPDLAIRKFTEMIDAGIPIPIFGDGSSGRDYTFIDDIVAGIIAALDYDCRYEVFNLGNSSPVQLKTLIAMIEAALGRKAHLRWLPDQPGDVPITFADISRARRLLHYQPQVRLEDGLARFVAWKREQDAALAVSA
jgi:UDP-glucuronate 4-epimerase